MSADREIGRCQQNIKSTIEQKEEINTLRHLKIGEDKIPESIARKAAAHARPLLAARRTAFFEDEEGARGGPAGYLVRRAAVEALRRACAVRNREIYVMGCHTHRPGSEPEAAWPKAAEALRVVLRTDSLLAATS